MTHHKKSPFASDDKADSLLADILDETADEARREEAELERSLTEREEARQREAEEARQAQIASRQAKLQKELERQANLEERRTQKMKALRVDDPPEPEQQPARAAATTPGPDALRREIREQVRREFENTPVPRMAPAGPPAEPPRTRRSVGAIAAIAAVLVAGAVGGAGFALTSRYEPDTNPYAKAVFAPADRDALAMEMGMTPLPKPEPAAEPEERPARDRVAHHAPKPERKPKEKPKETASAWGKPKQNDANKSLSDLEDALNNADDPFTIDED